MSNKFHPVVAKINERIAMEGGELLRGRPVEGGHMQYWVKRGDGTTISAPTVTAIADRLGIDRKESAKVASGEWIDTAKAAEITGYSTTALHNAGLRGELKREHPVNNTKTWLYKKSEVLSWSAEKKAKGSQYLPRVRRKSGPTQPIIPGTNGTKRDTSQRYQLNPSPLRDRINKYLAKMQGTPFEMTQTEFVEKVIDQALKKLGA